MTTPSQVDPTTAGIIAASRQRQVEPKIAQPEAMDLTSFHPLCRDRIHENHSHWMSEHRSRTPHPQVRASANDRLRKH
jgi:hypothetical protein